MFQGIWPKKIAILIVLSIVTITISTLFKSAVELEDAEQAYYSQWLRWGYDDQPPLYTWIQYLFNQVLGTTKISFSLLRGLVFGSILYMVYSFSKRYSRDIKIAALSVFALALVPVFIDFTFRRLSHTSLLCLSVLTTYFIIEKLVSKRTVWQYIVFGICMAFGLLSKYNYGLFLAALVLASLFDRQLKDVLFDKKILLSILSALLIVIPHFYWLLGTHENFLEIQESIHAKMSAGHVDNFFTPILSTLKVFLVLIGPLALVLSIFVFRKSTAFLLQKWDWLSKLFASQLLILLLFLFL